MNNNGAYKDSCRHGTDRTQERRSQAQRDAATVEIGYALASAAFVAAVASGFVAGPALFLPLSPGTVHALVTAGGVLAAILFPLRVVTVLYRFHRHGTPAQPSQPGRTNPDS
ncbi:DUF6332 family protein [Streptomyces aureus]|uniref:DUF6332 family protein n=1 Tax=Streptomyces aureus TaxID=193461 RepID=UPI0036844C82